MSSEVFREELRALDYNPEADSYDQNRCRTWACVLYPESIPSDYLDIIDSFHVQAFLSPLHDIDVFPDGSPEKPHFHLMLMFDGKKSKEQVLRLLLVFNIHYVKRIDSVRGYARYLCHLDYPEGNPKKHHYALSDVVSFSGADYLAYALSSCNITETLKEIVSFINEYHILYYDDLVCVACDSYPQWLYLLSHGQGSTIREFLRARKSKQF